MDDIFKAFREIQMLKEMRKMREAMKQSNNDTVYKCPNCGCPCHNINKEECDGE